MHTGAVNDPTHLLASVSRMQRIVQTPLGRTTYATNGARRFLDTGGQDTTGAAVKQASAQLQLDDAAQRRRRDAVVLVPLLGQRESAYFRHQSPDYALGSGFVRVAVAD